MPAAFEAIHTNRITANRLGLQRVAHRGAFVDHLDPRLFEHWQPFRRVVARCFHCLHAALDQHADIARIVRCFHHRQKGEIDTKRLVRHVAAFFDFPRQVFGRALGEAGDDA